MFTIVCIWWISWYTIFSSASQDGGLFQTSSQDYPWYEYFFDLYDVKVIQNDNAEMTYPDWLQPNTAQDITDLSHWVDILPFAQDKNRNGYVVYPRHGLVIPLDKTSNEDTKKIMSGQAFDHYPYLEDGALHYRGKDPRDGNGNMIIAAHSSYEKSEPGRYKTAFQVLPISHPGDHIFLYQKNSQGTYDLYDYVIHASFETDMYDTSVLAQTTNKKTLTTYGCYEIWVNDKRRVNQATLKREVKNIELQSKNTLPKKIATNPSTKINWSQLHPESTNNTQPWANIIKQEENTPPQIINNEYIHQISQPQLNTDKPIQAVQEKIPEVHVHQLSDDMLAKVDGLIEQISKRIWNNTELDIKVEYRLARKLIQLKDTTSPSAQLKRDILKYIQYTLYPTQ